MSKHDDNLFKKVVTGGLQKQHLSGIAQGSYAMCKVVLDMANREDQDDATKLEAIRVFCGKCIDPNKIDASK